MSTTIGLHIATVRQYDVSSGKATLVVPGLYGDAAVEAWPFLTSPTTVASLPTLNPGDTVVAFYDGGNPMVILRWFLTGGKVSGGSGGGITTEDAVDAVAAALRAGAGVSVVYNDPGNTITITNTAGAGGLDTEGVIDAVAAALTAGAGISISYDDPGGTITVNATSTGVDEVWVGPGTPPAAQEIWYDTDAVAPTSFYLTGVVKSTAPSASDFGGSIPLNAVWVKSP